MGSLGNTPRQQTVLTLAARKSFAFGLQFRTQEKYPVALTGATIRFVMAQPDYRGGAVVLTQNAAIIDDELGVAQVSLQADDLDLTEDDYPFSVTLLSALGYSTLVLQGVVTVTANPDTSTTGTYADVNPSTNIAVYLDNGNLINVTVASVDGMNVIVSTLLAQAETAAANAIAAAQEATAALASVQQGNAGLLTVGQETIPREVATALVSQSTGNLRLSFFTSRKNEVVTKLRTVSGAAAGATPTLCRVGLYRVGSDDGLTLVASCANTTGLWAAGSTGYDAALTSADSVELGARYAVGVLCVTGASAPTIAGTVSGPTADIGRAPRISGVLGSQTDLPSSIAAGSINDSTNRPYAVLLP